MTRLVPSVLVAAACGLPLVGCLLGGMNAAPPASNPAMQVPSMQPSHPPTTDAQWLKLEARAGSLAKEGTTRTLPPRRLVNTGFMVGTTIDVEPRTCYAAGITWAFSGGAAVSIMFEPVDDGPQPNDQMVRTGGKLEGGGGVVPFCADNRGRATISVTATTPQGIAAPNELLEYAVVVGARHETKDQTAARRADEKARVAVATAQMDANIAAAKQREREQLGRRCIQCEDELSVCRAERAHRRRHPRPGVSVLADCEQEFRLCSFAGARTKMDRSDAWPCGEP